MLAALLDPSCKLAAAATGEAEEAAAGDLVCSGTMRLPTGLFSAMLLGVVAMLFGLAIGVTISGGLPDIIVLAPQALPPEPEPEVTDVTNVDLGSPSIADENFNPGYWLQKPIFRTR